MIAPAAATVIALVVLAVGLRRVAGATTALRGSLRKTAATAVAGDELTREVSTVADHAVATRAASDGLRASQRGRRRNRAHR